MTARVAGFSALTYGSASHGITERSRVLRECDHELSWWGLVAFMLSRALLKSVWAELSRSSGRRCASTQLVFTDLNVNLILDQDVDLNVDLGRCLRAYSLLSAVTGSILMARRPGTHEATATTSNSRADMAR
jgi:hypothetical protein